MFRCGQHKCLRHPTVLKMYATSLVSVWCYMLLYRVDHIFSSAGPLAAGWLPRQPDTYLEMVGGGWVRSWSPFFSYCACASVRVETTTKKNPCAGLIYASRAAKKPSSKWHEAWVTKLFRPCFLQLSIRWNRNLLEIYIGVEEPIKNVAQNCQNGCHPWQDRTVLSHSRS